MNLPGAGVSKALLQIESVLLAHGISKVRVRVRVRVSVRVKVRARVRVRVSYYS